MWAVVADCGAVDENPSISPQPLSRSKRGGSWRARSAGGWSFPQRCDDVVGALDAARIDQVLEFLTPAVIENPLPRQMHYGIAIAHRFHPWARLHRIADNYSDSIAPQLLGGLGAARQRDDLVAALTQLFHQQTAHQSGAAGNEDPHEWLLTRPTPGS